MAKASASLCIKRRAGIVFSTMNECATVLAVAGLDRIFPAGLACFCWGSCRSFKHSLTMTLRYLANGEAAGGEDFNPKESVSAIARMADKASVANSSSSVELRTSNLTASHNCVECAEIVCGPYERAQAVIV